MALVLIGPIAAGKTTLAKRLSSTLDRKHISLDDTRWIHYPELGYRPEKARTFIEAGDFWGLARHWHAFDLHNIQRTLESHPEAIVDFGGGHTLFFEGEEAEALKTLLKQHTVLLVLPSRDREENIRILRERIHSQGEHPEAIYNLNVQMIDNSLNRELADHVLYTSGKTPEESVQGLLDWMKDRKQKAEGETRRRQK